MALYGCHSFPSDRPSNGGSGCDNLPPAVEMITFHSQESRVSTASSTAREVMCYRDLHQLMQTIQYYEVELRERVTALHPTEIHEASMAFLRIRAIYENEYRRDKKFALTIKPDVDLMQKYMQEINGEATRLTAFDLWTLATFSRRAVEDEYVDEVTGTIYYQPDHSWIMEYFEGIATQGEYSQAGIKRQHFIMAGTYYGRVCDIVFLTKRDDQVAYESRKKMGPPITTRMATYLKAFLWGKDLHKPDEEQKALIPQVSQIEQRIQKQKDLGEFLTKDLSKRIYRANYGEAIICDSEEYSLFGVSPQDALKYHAVIFLYKKNLYRERRD